MEIPKTIPGGEKDVLPIASFDESYTGIPPWDIGKPQPALMALIESGEVSGTVLDAGCGTGELSLALAARGFNVVGIDASPRAIEKAKTKAAEQNSSAYFQVADALNLTALGRRFDTIFDSGLFHCFSDANRARYVSSLETISHSGTKLLLMCFSEAETRPGPRRVTQAEIRAAFELNWNINYIRAERFESLMHDGGAAAWLASLTLKTN